MLCNSVAVVLYIAFFHSVAFAALYCVCRQRVLELGGCMPCMLILAGAHIKSYYCVERRRHIDAVSIDLFSNLYCFRATHAAIVNRRHLRHLVTDVIGFVPSHVKDTRRGLLFCATDLRVCTCCHCYLSIVSDILIGSLHALE